MTAQWIYGMELTLKWNQEYHILVQTNCVHDHWWNLIHGLSAMALWWSLRLWVKQDNLRLMTAQWIYGMDLMLMWNQEYHIMIETNCVHDPKEKGFEVDNFYSGIDFFTWYVVRDFLSVVRGFLYVVRDFLRRAMYVVRDQSSLQTSSPKEKGFEVDNFYSGIYIFTWYVVRDVLYVVRVFLYVVRDFLLRAIYILRDHSRM